MAKNDALLAIAVVGGAYLLTRQGTKTELPFLSGDGGGTTLDLSGLFAGLNLGGGSTPASGLLSGAVDIEGIVNAVLSAISPNLAKSAQTAESALEIAGQALEGVKKTNEAIGNIPTWIAETWGRYFPNTGGGTNPNKETSANPGTEGTQAPANKGSATPENGGGSGIDARQKAANEVTGVLGFAFGSKALASIFKVVAPRLFPKLVAAGSGIGMPLAIAWTGAEVLATLYEGISGKNIAGNWLGWGEVFWPQNTVNNDRPSTPAGNDRPNAVIDVQDYTVFAPGMRTWIKESATGGSAEQPAVVKNETSQSSRVQMAAATTVTRELISKDPGVKQTYEKYLLR